MNQTQLDLVRAQLKRLKALGGFYAKKLEVVDADDIKTREDFESLPFTSKEELRAAYPLGLQAVPDGQIVRIHSSSGTTGTPVIIPYTRKDVEDWTEMFARCYEMAGVTSLDRVHITPGYGLWTAGIGFQAGAEKIGAMVIPMGPGNTDKQLQMMQDLKSTVLCATSSYALLLAEEITRRGLKDRICLKKGIIGSERWGEKMRQRIAGELDIELYDIYGLTEIYGPGIAISCHLQPHMHYWDDFLYFEVIDPKTGRVLPDGETGELVITTLKKEGAPLIRYRTHDLTRIVPEECPCGSKFPRIGTIVGRTDDMVKVKGAIIYPSLVDEMLKAIPGASSEYKVVIDRIDGRDAITLFVEVEDGADQKRVAEEARRQLKAKAGITAQVTPVKIGELPRSEKKSKRIFDNRD